MNRSKVITEPISFKEYRRMTSGVLITNPVVPKVPLAEPEDEIMTLPEIIKFSKDKKRIKSDRKRKQLTKQKLLEYLEMTYSESDF